MVHLAQGHGLIYHVCSPAPSWFFDQELIDGGLLIVSRYPIIDTKFDKFNDSIPSLLADGFVAKGLLYAKIELRQDRILHLFNTHTQATENDITVQEYAETFVSRYEQLKLTKFVIDAII